MNFNIQCVGCTNPLFECGMLLETDTGPYVVCDLCSFLYYIEIVTTLENKPLIVVQPTKLFPEDEFNIIRTAKSRTSLKDYLPLEEEKNINPHFKKDIKEVIKESITPSDLVRKLKYES